MDEFSRPSVPKVPKRGSSSSQEGWPSTTKGTSAWPTLVTTASRSSTPTGHSSGRSATGVPGTESSRGWRGWLSSPTGTFWCATGRTIECRCSKLLFVIAMCVVSCWAQQIESQRVDTCLPSECLKVFCPSISKIYCTHNELGAFFYKGDRCGCCDVCVLFLDEDEECDPSPSLLAPRLKEKDKRSGCRTGLECNNATYTCVKIRTLNEEPDPQSSYTKSGNNQDNSGRQPGPSRSFLVRWSACNEPICDRGVCPPKMTRKNFCPGRFFPERHCSCCGECTMDLPSGEDGLASDEIDRSLGSQADKFTCGNNVADCYQTHRCKSGTIHRLQRYTCNGFWESADPTYCACCGACLNFFDESALCATVSPEGNVNFTRPGCMDGLECRKSPLTGLYTCLKPCPVAACANFKCEDGEDRLIDCPSDFGVFKSTQSVCACCGECQEYIPIGQPCMEGTNIIEPGCGAFLKCLAGVCGREASVKYIGPGRQKQIEMLMMDSLAWTGLKYPQIDREGFYYPVQCEAYKCYCVAPDGSELGYVMPRFHAFNMNCDCARQRYYGKAMLKCDHMGNYQELDFAGIDRPPPAVTEEA